MCVAAALALMILHDWRAMPSYTKREKTAYGVLTGLGAILAILLVLDPQMPDPTQWMDGTAGKLVGEAHLAKERVNGVGKREKIHPANRKMMYLAVTPTAISLSGAVVLQAWFSEFLTVSF